jgi:glycosyltransferase involved in cell wall biosynthesis
MNSTYVSVVIAAHNEEKTIESVIKDVYIDFKHLNISIVVVDDGSDDGTAIILKRLKGNIPCLETITHAQNQGYNISLVDGIFYCCEKKDVDIVVTFDADGQHFVEDIKRVLLPIENGEADYVIGVRNSLPRLFEKLVAHIVGVKDATCGLRALKPDISHIFKNEDVYGAESIIKARMAGFKVKEVPIETKERLHGIPIRLSFNDAFRLLKIFLLRLKEIFSAQRAENPKS